MKVYFTHACFHKYAGFYINPTTATQFLQLTVLVCNFPECKYSAYFLYDWFSQTNHIKQKQFTWQIKTLCLQCSPCMTNSSTLHEYFQFHFAIDKSHNFTKTILCYTTEYHAASRDKMKHIFIYLFLTP